MFGIIVNHLALIPNLLLFLTGATRLWVSFAEGFFMVSGFLLGALNRDRIVKGFWPVFNKMFIRALWLYFWTILLTLVFTNWGNLMPIGSVKTGLWQLSPSNLAEFFFKTLTFQYTYGWGDILPYYAIFLVFAPFYLWVLARGGVYYLLGINLFIWIFRGGNVYSSIQSLYFLGMVLGYYHKEILTQWDNWSIKTRSNIKLLTFSAFFISLIASIISVFFFESLAKYFGIGEWFVAKNRVLNLYFDKQTVGFGRVMLAPLWLLSGLFLFDDLKVRIEEIFGWILLTFGKNSLESYILHALVIFPIPFIVDYFGLTGWWWNTGVTVGAIVAIFLLTKFVVKIKKYLLDIR